MPTSSRGLHAVPALQPALTVAAVARKLGVAPSTLRTWDRRYGLGPSEHAAGSHRRYSAADVARLVVMRRLTLEGVPPAHAAALALATPAEAADRADRADTADRADRADTAATADLAVAPTRASSETRHLATVTPLAPTATPDGSVSYADHDDPDHLDHLDHLDHHADPTDADCARAGGGRVIALGDVGPAARGLARSALSLDGCETARLVRDAVDTLGVVRAWDDVVAPVLRGVGARWETTGLGVEVEHALSEAVAAVMRAYVARMENPRNACRIMLGCGGDDHHTLPLHVLAAALAERDVACRMFGLGMPAEALLTAVRRCGPAVVVLHAQLPIADASVLEEIPRLRPAPHLILGGPGWAGLAVPRHARTVASLAESVDEVLSVVG